MGLDFNWAQMISNEIYNQLENYYKTKRFFMETYLVYAIIYNYILEELSARKDIGSLEELVQFWYPMLWNHKCPFHIYQIHDELFGCCRAILTETIPDIFTQGDKYFLEGKGLLYLKK